MIWRHEWHLTSSKSAKQLVWDTRVGVGGSFIKISDMYSAPSGGTHCLVQQHSARETHQPALQMTFSWELTQHITVQLIKWFCFRSSALTPIFQGAEIRSTVTEECLPNKHWCITSLRAGWRWVFSCLHAEDPDLYFTQFNMVHLICVFCSAKLRESPLGYHMPQSLSSDLYPSCICYFVLVWGHIERIFFFDYPSHLHPCVLSYMKAFIFFLQS